MGGQLLSQIAKLLLLALRGRKTILVFKSAELMMGWLVIAVVEVGSGLTVLVMMTG